MISLVMLQYNHSDLTIKALESLTRDTCAGITYRLIVVDNGSDNFHFQRVRDWVESHGGQVEIYLISCPKNGGFAYGMNTGMRYAIEVLKSSCVVLLNNDVTFTDGWLMELVKPFKLDATIGIIGSQTDNISSVQATVRLQTVCKLDDPWYEQKDHNVAYFCTAIKREVIEKVGYLDENFFNGGEDDDYNDRARIAGFKVGVAPRSFVHHDHLLTRKDPELDYRGNGKKNREYLRMKREERKKCSL